MKEATLERNVRELFSGKGIPCAKAGGRMAPGLSDRVGCLPPNGRMFLIELKAPGKYDYNNETCPLDHKDSDSYVKTGSYHNCKGCGCTALQLRRIDEYNAAGAIAFSADNVLRIKWKLGLGK